MAWTVYQSLIAVLMVITGSINTISTKLADMTESEGRPNGNKTIHSFDHPFVQSAGMFLGETFCLLAFFLIRLVARIRKVDDVDMPDMVQSDSFNKFIFFIPAALDMTATTIMYIGLSMTYASSFQMLRGALIVFTGLLTITVLKRQLKFFQWIGIFVIIIGLATVGSNDFLKDEDSGSSEVATNSMIVGDILIILAQILTAFQMIVEEKFMRGRNIAPLQAVGFEGLFGFMIASILLIPLFYIKVMRDGNWVPIEDPYDAYLQIINNWRTALAIGGNVVSIAFFNFAGISVTKEISATTRTVLDSIRTLVVWLFFLSIGHEKYATLQLLGFFLLVIGIMIHNDVLIRPYLISHGYISDDTDRYNMINRTGNNQSPSTVQEEDGEEDDKNSTSNQP